MIPDTIELALSADYRGCPEMQREIIAHAEDRWWVPLSALKNLVEYEYDKDYARVLELRAEQAAERSGRQARTATAFQTQAA